MILYNPKQPCFRPLIAYSVKATKEMYVSLFVTISLILFGPYLVHNLSKVTIKKASNLVLQATFATLRYLRC